VPKRPDNPQEEALPSLKLFPGKGNHMVTGRPEAPVGRRQFVCTGVTLAATTAFHCPALSAPHERNRPWIPSKEFLTDLPHIMEVASLPGLAMATVENGAVVWTQAVGVTNVETRAPVREDSVFEAASMSKPVFAYVVQRLADEKLIDLDCPLAQYRRPDYLPHNPDIDLITARDVLRHSTGFPNWRIRPEDVLTVAFKPGSRWRYSGEGFFWLQLVVEHMTGQGLDTVMRSRLFEPAKMPLSTFGWNADIARLSVYGREVGQTDLRLDQRGYAPGPAGGLDGAGGSPLAGRCGEGAVGLLQAADQYLFKRGGNAEYDRVGVCQIHGPDARPPETRFLGDSGDEPPRHVKSPDDEQGQHDLLGARMGARGISKRTCVFPWRQQWRTVQDIWRGRPGSPTGLSHLHQRRQRGQGVPTNCQSGNGP
jgi:hypothetical protein